MRKTRARVSPANAWTRSEPRMSHLSLPSPDLAILQRRNDILKQLKKLVPDAILITDQEGRRTFETDALTAYRCLPLAVVLPESTEEVSAILRFCHENHVKVVPRGAGTSLSGGALPLEDAIVLCLTRMNKVLSIELTVRLLKAAEGARPMLLGFDSNERAGACVAGIIAAGIIPVALEFMDRPAIHVCEHFVAAGYPLDVEALLIVEVEGSEDEIDTLLEKIGEIAEDYHPLVMRRSQSAEESAKIWKGRKNAFGAIGQLSDYYCMDGVIPLSKLSKALDEIGWICRKYRFDVANIFHAGDGNLHPLILYNANDPLQLERVELCGAEILKLCVELGGCLTGEHGVGIEKRELMRVQYSDADLAQQMRVKAAFDPDWLLNPGKVFPLEGSGLQ